MEPIDWALKSSLDFRSLKIRHLIVAQRMRHGMAARRGGGARVIVLSYISPCIHTYGLVWSNLYVAIVIDRRVLRYAVTSRLLPLEGHSSRSCLSLVKLECFLLLYFSKVGNVWLCEWISSRCFRKNMAYVSFVCCLSHVGRGSHWFQHSVYLFVKHLSCPFFLSIKWYSIGRERLLVSNIRESLTMYFMIM